METNLQALRKTAGYKSAREFAEHAGINVYTYTNYEQGRRNLTLEEAEKLADILGCSLDELAGRDFQPAELYSDDRQRDLNSLYDKLNESGRDYLLITARHICADPDLMLEECHVDL